VRLEGIGKRFPGVVANDDVHLEVAQGEIHAIVGENGAGKSTLMKILYGMQRPDEGTIEVEGTEVHFRSPREAIEAGIGMVHQHFMLAGNLTVLENVVLGREPRKGPNLDRAAARDRIRTLSRSQGVSLDPEELLETLSVGEKQRVEIIKVLYRGARILILDEPTGVLVPQEVDELFEHLRELREQGVTIIFISHKLHEVLEIADRITVLRAGRTVTTVEPREVTARELARAGARVVLGCRKVGKGKVSLMQDVMQDESASGGSELTGRLVYPDSPDYESARLLWARQFSKFPLVIVFCQNVQDVVNAISWCREHDVAFRARSGGHALEGWSSVDGGVIIDVSDMNQIHVDERAGVARHRERAVLGSARLV
jgi:ABC-type multidrug transport system ATPase subunit